MSRNVFYSLSVIDYLEKRLTPTSPTHSPIPLASRNANRSGAAQYANATIVVSDNICLTER